jgi:hypothetical protein
MRALLLWVSQHFSTFDGPTTAQGSILQTVVVPG